MIKRYFFLLLGLCSYLTINAQAPADGMEYYLPKTQLRFRVLVEKTTTKAGEYAVYAERYLKKSVPQDKEVSYRVIGINLYSTATPDTTGRYFLPMDKKHTIFSAEKDANGVLLSINAKPSKVTVPAKFVSSPALPLLNPHDFMSEDILKAGNKAKMAELTAREIYDIRDSRNQLIRGEADYMPKDGEQLKLMLESLEQQESALLQAFAGYEQKDTIEHEVVITPEEGVEQEVLFRLSKRLGLVDCDDLSGKPYYISIQDLHTTQDLDIETPETGKKQKANDDIMLCLPGKAKIVVLDSNHKQILSTELYLAQYGTHQPLSGTLFSKKQTAHVVINPQSGYVESLKVEPLE